MRAGRIKLQLFLEGVETKISQIIVSYGDNTLPTATINVPYSKHIINCRYGTKVHVFEWDFEKEEWRLLFDGYVAGVQFVKRPSMRYVAISAVSNGTIWSRAYKNFLTLDSILNKGKEKLSTGDPNAITVIDYIMNILSIFGQKNRVFEAVANVLTYDGSTGYMYNGEKRSAKVERVTPLMNFLADKLYKGSKIAQRLYGIESTGAIGEMASFEYIWNIIIGAYARMPAKASLLQIAQMIMSMVNYKLVSNAQFASNLGEFIVSPQSFFILPPLCNLVPPNVSQGFSYSRNYEAEPTRAHYLFPEMAMKLAGNLPPSMSSKHITSPKYIDDFKLEEDDNGYLLSKWEKEHGIKFSEAMLPMAVGYVLKKKDPEQLQKYADAVWTRAYLSARSFKLEVDPTLDIVPGAGLLVADEAYGHMLAYVSHVTKMINASGSSTLQLVLHNARHYSEFSEEYASKIDPLFSDIATTKEYYSYLGTEPAFDSIDAQSVKKKCEEYAKAGKIYKRDIISKKDFMAKLGITQSGKNLSWSEYEPDGGESEFEIEKYWADGKTINPNKRQLIHLHNEEIKWMGIRG